MIRRLAVDPHRELSTLYKVNSGQKSSECDHYLVNSLSADSHIGNGLLGVLRILGVDVSNELPERHRSISIF